MNSNWNVAVGDGVVCVDLPYDATACAARDYSCAFGALNGYIPAERAVFTRSLPQLKTSALLGIFGVCGCGRLFINDNYIATLETYSPNYITLGEGVLSDAHNVLRVELFTSPAMSDKYLGLGIAGGAELFVGSALDIEHRSLFVKTVTVGDRTYADTELTVVNNGDNCEKFVLECAVTNARGKRAGKKQRKLCLHPHRAKTLSVRVRINNPYEWSPSDPYTYTMTARIINVSGEDGAESVRFGIASRFLSPTRGMYVNGRKKLLVGAYISHADAALGSASYYCNEKRRLSALKAIGYNAVHFVGCPTAAALDACDDVGLYAYVDIFPQLFEQKSPLGGLRCDDFDPTSAIKELRNHPCVVIYGVADDVPECYNRSNGHAIIAKISNAIRACDGSRPVTVSVRELVPTRGELESVGCKKTVFDDAGAAINAGREKALYETLTFGAFSSVDACGFNYLPSLYETELIKRNRLVLGSRTGSDRAFDSLAATEKNDRVIGDFNECGIDYPGGGKLNEIITTRGDIDAICCEKPQAVYKRVLLGARGVAYIVVRDPDTNEAVHMWNWPRFLGQKIKVEVYTSGDVVALYLDGRIVGRKLAGKINKHIATFMTEYYPGTLEAVAFFKGVECARNKLKSAGSPKLIKLSAFEKNLSVARRDLGFVYVDVCDRDGELVPYAMRSLTATVTGGELLGFINADPMLRKGAFDSCPAFGGRALAVIRPDPGEVKAAVKISGDGLISSKISFKIKN